MMINYMISSLITIVDDTIYNILQKSNSHSIPKLAFTFHSSISYLDLMSKDSNFSKYLFIYHRVENTLLILLFC